MCSRIFVAPGKPLQLLLDLFGLKGTDLPEINNLAPTEAAPVIYREDSGFNISPMRWWLHPSWSPEAPNQKFAMFNARIETVLTSRAFQGPVRHRRAIIPVSGFVEFKTQGKQKPPLYVQTASGEALAVAAIWECWQNQVWSTAIITHMGFVCTQGARMFVKQPWVRYMLIHIPTETVQREANGALYGGMRHCMRLFCHQKEVRGSNVTYRSTSLAGLSSLSAPPKQPSTNPDIGDSLTSEISSALFTGGRVDSLHPDGFYGKAHKIVRTLSGTLILQTGKRKMIVH